jgi:hypothetical protein
MFPDTNLLFVHRDADAAGPRARRGEIAAAVGAFDPSLHHVAVVPVQSTEAWLLVDEDAIRRAVGIVGDKPYVDLPRRSAIEATARPKEVLERVVDALQASRSRRHRHDFATVRRRLLERLDVDPQGAVRDLPAFAELVAEIEIAVGAIM